MSRRFIEIFQGLANYLSLLYFNVAVRIGRTEYYFVGKLFNALEWATLKTSAICLLRGSWNDQTVNLAPTLLSVNDHMCTLASLNCTTRSTGILLLQNTSSPWNSQIYLQGVVTCLICETFSLYRRYKHLKSLSIHDFGYNRKEIKAFTYIFSTLKVLANACLENDVIRLLCKYLL